jgi:hypothetical protein
MAGVVSVVLSYHAIQYIGSNSADVDAAITDFTIDSESGGVLNCTSGSIAWTVNTNDWVIFVQGAVYNVHTPAQFAYFYDVNALISDVAGVPSGILSAGIGTAPTILASGNATVSVPMIPAMPSTGLTANARVFGGTILGTLTVTSVTVTSTTNVDVVVHNPGLLSISGAHILVDAS